MKPFAIAIFLLVYGASAFAAEMKPTTATLPRTADRLTTSTLATRKLPLSEQQKIEILIQTVEDSGLGFIRNGTQYDSKRAAEHLRLKVSRARKRIKTARDFIKYLASGSSVSGDSYQLVLKNGTKVKSADWLTARLIELEKMEAAAIAIQKKSNRPVAGGAKKRSSAI